MSARNTARKSACRAGITVAMCRRMSESKRPSAGHPVARTVTFEDNGRASGREWVICPRTRGSVPLARCRTCKHLNDLTPGAPDQPQHVVCSEPQTGEHSLLPRELPLRLPRLSVSDLMTRNVVCVRLHLTLDAVAQLFLETGLHTVPVVDGRGKVLGTVSNEDVQLAVQTHRGPASEPAHVSAPASRTHLPLERSVADVMLPLVLTIPEHASVVQAAALLVVEALDRVTVVSDSGQVVGIIAASDILHWLAREDGFALPRRMG